MLRPIRQAARMGRLGLSARPLEESVHGLHVVVLLGFPSVSSMSEAFGGRDEKRRFLSGCHILVGRYFLPKDRGCTT